MNQSLKTARENARGFKMRFKTGVLCSLTVLAAPAASTCGGPDMTGTWATKIDIPGQLALSSASLSVNVQSTLRINIAKSGTDFVHKVELCTLATPTADPATIAIIFKPAMVQTLTATATAPASTPAIGGPVTIPPFTILTGSTTPCNGTCTEADFSDSDHDAQPGVTIPANLGPPLNLTMDAYTALTVQFWLISATLQDASTMSGSAAFGAHGQVLRTNNPLITGGRIDVTSTSPTTPVTFTRLGAGDIPCSTVVQRLP